MGSPGRPGLASPLLGGIQFIPRDPAPVTFVLEGEVENAFQIQEHGIFRSTRLLDRETKNLYRLWVKTVNDEGRVIEGPSAVNVFVEDINDNVPIFNQSEYYGEAREKSRPGKTIIRVSATDADDPETPNAQLVYKIVYQIPDTKIMYFQINNHSGEISLTLNGSQLVDVHTEDSYELTVSVSDLSVRPFSANTKVVIKITENIWKSPSPITIVENSTEPHPIKITQVQWNDEGAIYEIHQRDKFRRFPFTIDQDGNINVTEPLDREEQSLYIFSAFAKNQNGIAFMRAIDIEVNVQDINDNPPTCPGPVTIFEIQENELVGSFIGELAATDLDEPGSRNALLRFRIVSQNPKIPEDGMFFLDEISGSFRLIKSGLDIDDVDLYIIKVNVTDQGSGLHPALSTLCEVHIKVIDVNDQIPIFETSDYGNVTVSEGLPLQTVIFEIQATDADQQFTGSSEIIYEIEEGEHKHLFVIDTDKETNRGYVKIFLPLDYETSKMHKLVIHARNPEPLFTGVEYNDSSITHLKVIVTDVDEVPQFESSILQKQVSEDIPIGTLLIKVVAIDPEGDDVIFGLKGDKRNWLWINETTGDIYTNAELDRETESSYQVQVTAKERKNPSMSSSVYLHIYLDDVNDNAPTLSSSYNGPVYCNPLSKPESLIFEGVDADSTPRNRGIRFSLVADEETNKNWTLSFVNITHAKLSMNHNYFPIGIHRVPVTLTDTGRPPLTSVVYVPVTICACSSDNHCISDSVEESFGKPSVGMALGILFGVLGVIGIIVAAVFISIDQKKKKQTKAPTSDAANATETVRLAS
uniref:Cadherin 17 n=1 Tax=Leptobrachium leishanense TaxID=445787 RepID=A0A8C5PY92_9ANUR